MIFCLYSNDGTAETTLKRCYFKNASQDQVSCSGWQKSGNLQDGNQERDGVHVPPGSSININIKCIAKSVIK